jgi:cell division protein FtsN
MTPMRISLIIILAAFIVLPSCKSKRMTVAEPPPAVEEVAVASQPDPEPEVIAEIPARTERFTFERPEEQTAHEFFVIVGSYSMIENANRARTILTNQGFNPIILKSETGLNRLCIDSYTNETQARVRVHQIRTNYPEYHDAWLLIRQR